MWNVYRGDPLPIALECLDESDDPVDLTDYTVGLNLVWGDDDDERLEYEQGDLTITAADGLIELEIDADTVEDSLPLGKKTQVFLLLTAPGSTQLTNPIGKITVYAA